MYDTVHLLLPQLDVINTHNLLEEVSTRINIKNEGRNTETDNLYCSGKLKNMKISISESRLTVKGSLSKYFYDDPLKTLTIEDTQKAFQQLSEQLRVDISQAKVTRFDFAEIVYTNYQPETYYHHLGEAKHFARLQNTKSIYYRNKTRQLHFYNKIAELISNGVIIKPSFKNQNLLKYEIQFLKPKNHFNGTIKGFTLYNPIFYNQIIDKWYKAYSDIAKVNLYNFDMENIDKPKDFIKYLANEGIKSLGGVNKVVEMVEYLRKHKALSKPEYYSRTKREIRTLANKNTGTLDNNLIEELDKKLFDIYKYQKNALINSNLLKI